MAASWKATPAMRVNKRKSPAELQAQCDRWNRKHGVGTLVCVQFDSGEIATTKTRSGAYVLNGHSAVIFLEGISGCYSLDRVEAI